MHNQCADDDGCTHTKVSTTPLLGESMHLAMASPPPASDTTTTRVRGDPGATPGVDGGV